MFFKKGNNRRWRSNLQIERDLEEISHLGVIPWQSSGWDLVRLGSIPGQGTENKMKQYSFRIHTCIIKLKKQRRDCYKVQQSGHLQEVRTVGQDRACGGVSGVDGKVLFSFKIFFLFLDVLGLSCSKGFSLLAPSGGYSPAAKHRF